MNSSDKLSNEMLTAYFDGELSQAEQLQVEQALFDHPEYARQLRNWAELRDALQQAARVIETRVAHASSRVNPSEPDDLESLVMKRISTAMAAGEVKWATGSSAGATPASLDFAANQALKSNQEHAAVGPDSKVQISASIAGNSNHSAGTGWMSDHRLNPSRRLRRWQWQVGLLSTIVAGLFLTVYLNPNPLGPRTALGPPESGGAASGTSEVATQGELGQSGLTEAMARVAPNQASGLSDNEVNPLLSDLNPDVIASVMRSATNPDSTQQDEYRTFVSYDMADPEVGLGQMRSVLDNNLANNYVTLVDSFQLDDAQVVVLSGDAKNLAEILESFQAAGDNSLTLIAKVGPEFESPEGATLNTFVGPMMADVSPLNPSLTVTPPVPGRPAEMAAGSLENRPGEAQQAEAAEQKMLAQDSSPGNQANQGNAAQSPLASNIDMDSALAQGSGIAGDVGGNILSFNNYRQDVIRSQANVFNNSISPSKGLTLEEFLNERPAPKRPRVPFGGPPNPEVQGMAASSEQSNANPAQQEAATESLKLAPEKEAAVSADQSANRARGNESMPNRNGTNKAARGMAVQNATPGTEVPVEPFNQRGQDPATPDQSAVMTPQSDANATQLGAPQTQVVVLLRPKARTQQSP
jgi:hypothetical protein